MSKITLAEYLSKKKLQNSEIPELEEIEPFNYNVFKVQKSAEELIDLCIKELENNTNPLHVLKILNEYKTNKLLDAKTKEITRLANDYFLGIYRKNK